MARGVTFCKTEAELIGRLPEVGVGTLGVFLPLPKRETRPFARNILRAADKDPRYLLQRSDIPPTVNRLAIAVAAQNGYRPWEGQRMVGRSRIFGVTHPVSGAHIDTNLNNLGTQMPLLGSWVLFTGACRVSLLEVPSFDFDEISDFVEEHRVDTLDPGVELRVTVRPEKTDAFTHVDINGPCFGVWPIGISPDRGIHTTLHQIATIGSEPRVSTTLLQNYTDRRF